MAEAESPINNLTYLPYTEDLEGPLPDEEESINKIVDDLRKNNELQFKKRKKKRKEPHAIRDAHAKSHGILVGELRVHPDLPDHLRQGMFAEPGKTYQVIARLSSTSGAIRSERVRGVRGLGLKVLGVQGRRADPHFKEPNQDFVFVTEPEFLFKDALDYSKSGMLTAKILARTPDPVMIVANTVLRGARRILAVFGAELPKKLAVFADENYNILGQTFFTAAPIVYGKYIAKISVAPSSKSVTALIDTTVTPGKESLTKAVEDFVRTNSAEYVVSAQLCTDKTTMPIEDAKVPWSTEDSPYQRIATITYPAQNTNGKKRQEFGENLTFNSWRAIEDHRPLGSINRLKKKVYEESSKFRHERNEAERLEPSTTAGIPD
jgi:hypothetical protein